MVEFREKGGLKTGALLIYLNSDGRQVGRSFNIFAKQAEEGRQQDCCFCKKPLVDSTKVEVFMYPGGHQVVKTGVYACEVCGILIKQMEHHRIPDEEYDDEPVEESTDSEVHDRIWQYVHEMEFDSDVVEFFTHNRLLAGRSTDAMLRCYFCRTLVGENVDYVHLDVPVRGNYYLDGGQIFCCMNCRALIREESSPLMEKNLFFTGTLLNNAGCVIEVCHRCHENYYVGPVEFQGRLQAETIGRCYCPSCAVEAALEAEQNRGLYGKLFSLQYNEQYINRFNTDVCSYCREELVDVDLYLSFEMNKLFCFSAEDRLICTTCAEGGHPLAIINGDSYIWILYDLGHESYKVHIRQTGSKMKVGEYTARGNVHAIIASAHSVLENPPRQLKLDM